MDPIIVKVDERLEGAGSALPLSGHIDEHGYSLGDHEFELPQGIDYDLVLTNAGEGILASGLVRAHMVGTCDRCLEPAEFDVASEMDEYFLFQAPPAEELNDDEDEVDFSLVSDEDTIDLSEPIMSALLMETPFVVLCREDCKGLCPTCGANLNEGDCGCAAKRAEEAKKESPFAALAGLSFDGDGSEDVSGESEPDGAEDSGEGA